jgi:hypothetical protein
MVGCEADKNGMLLVPSPTEELQSLRDSASGSGKGSVVTLGVVQITNDDVRTVAGRDEVVSALPGTIPEAAKTQSQGEP